MVKTRNKSKKPSKRWRPWLKRLGLFALLIFALLNWIAYNHAYSFTHTDESLQGEFPQQQVYEMSQSSFWGKLGYLFWGIKVPKSLNTEVPRLRQLMITARTWPMGWCWNVLLGACATPCNGVLS